MKNKKELPICDAPIYTAFLEYAFPCAVMQSDKRLRNLLYISFFDLYWDDNYNGKLQLYNFDLLDYLLFDYRKMDKTVINIDSKINNKIKKWLKEGYYICAFVDEAELKATQLSNVPGKIHESLIYGFDDNFGNFSILNFDQNERFGKIGINQKDFKKACLSNIDETKFFLLKPSFDVVNIEIKLIEKRITYYLTGKNIQVGKCRNILKNDYVWGIHIYDSLVKYIQITNSPDFRIFKLLEEHKIYLYEVYKYLLPIIKDYELENDFVGLIGLIKKMNLSILRQNLIETSEQKNKILDFLFNIKAEEESLLIKYTDDLKIYLNNNKNYNNIEYLD